MNLKNKLRMCFLVIAIIAMGYVMLYYFYDGGRGDNLGQAILVSVPISRCSV